MKYKNFVWIFAVGVCLLLANHSRAEDLCRDVLEESKYLGALSENEIAFFHFLSKMNEEDIRVIETDGGGSYGPVSGDASYYRRNRQRLERLDQKTYRIAKSFQSAQTYMPTEAIEAWKDCMLSTRGQDDAIRLVVTQSQAIPRNEFTVEIIWNPPPNENGSQVELSDIIVDVATASANSSDAISQSTDCVEERTESFGVLLGSQTIRVCRGSLDDSIDIDVVASWGSKRKAANISIPPYVQPVIDRGPNPAGLAPNPMCIDSVEQVEARVGMSRLAIKKRSEKVWDLGGFIRVSGGVFMQPSGSGDEDAYVRFSVPEGSTHFRSIVGYFEKCDGGLYGNAFVKVRRVYESGDIETAWQQNIYQDHFAANVLVPVRGAAYLDLAVDRHVQGNWCDHIVWGEARFVQESD